MSSGGRPTLGAVLSGRGGVAGQAAQNVMQRAADVLQTVKDNEELKGAATVIRAATGGASEVQMDPVKTAIDALKAGADLANDRDTRQAAAAAAKAQADVAMAQVKQEGELGIINAVLALSDRFGGDKGGGQLDTFVRLLELTRPQQQSSGTNMEGIATLIGALTPLILPLLERRGGDDSATRELVNNLTRQIEKLQDRMEHQHSGSGQSLDATLGLLEKLQKVTGTSVHDRIELRRLDVEESLGKHEITERENSRRAEAENNGQFMGGVFELAKAWNSGEAKRGGGQTAVPDAPQSNAARRVSVKCGNCGGIIPIQGDPPASMTCPHCNTTIGRGVA